ncbi:MAG: pacearchaeosortase [Nanoarchaeota archaeon]
MKYGKRLILRYSIAVIFAIVGIKIIYFIFSPLTFYSSYYSIYYLSPKLIGSTSFIINNIKLNFISACTAASAYLLLVLLTLTTDIKLKKALRVIFAGSLLILIANLIRIDILIIALVKYGSNLFNTLHLFFWKVLSTVFVVILWIFLTKVFKIKEIPIYSDFKKIYSVYRKPR